MPEHPVATKDGVLYVMPFIRRDMLMLENQLPLLVLERLVAVMTAQPPVVANMTTSRYNFVFNLVVDLYFY